MCVQRLRLNKNGTGAMNAAKNDVLRIHAKKRPLNLVLISHKYSQRNTDLGITFCHRYENCFHCSQKVKKLNAV